ncbi:lanthionine synthetase LanC family protein [Streptomyces sp. NPDC093707]|uniref:lanthionine synthetase LanC family protein n=1 Tax=Streptomyces sp. NPDC093707 TaxID=3154984 RepID=UPI003450AC26
MRHRAAPGGCFRTGQRDAIASLAGLLTHWAVRDAHGVYWPGHLSLAQWLAGSASYDEPAGWPSWCYGAPGVSRALQLAGRALDRPDWTVLAAESVERLLTLPLERWGITDHALCHGWAGALHQLGRLAEDFATAHPPHTPSAAGTTERAGLTDRTELSDLTDRIGHRRDAVAARLLDAFDPDAPFGYRFTMTRVPFASDVSGYLDGASGVALALDAYATGGATTDWDMPLLLA